MDDLLVRTVALLARPAGQAETRAVAAQLLARPSHDPGGATYLTWLRPLPWTDTKSYQDMIKIIALARQLLAVCAPGLDRARRRANGAPPA